MRKSIWLFVVIWVIGLAVCAQQTAASESTNHKAGERMVKTVDGIEYAFRWCPPGKFSMGSPNDEDGRDEDEFQHEVTLTQGFWMLETEVTQAMWKNVMDKAPGYFKGDDLPVEIVNWDECQDFCQRLSSKIGMKISLPTEAQWEYACRAGSTGPFAGDLDTMGWYGHEKCKKTTHPVAEKQANAWGLYDMHGNVWEWCQDWYGDYPNHSVTDPTGPASGTDHVCRGGSWYNLARACRSADRGKNSADYRFISLGFRVVSQ